MSYFLSIFPHYFRSYNLGFPSLYIHKNILKHLWKQKILYLRYFLVISQYFVARFSVLIYSRKFFEKFMKTKNIVFKWLLSNFVARIFHSYIFTKKIWKQKYCILNNLSDFWVISNNFVTQIFRCYIFPKIFWKIRKTKKLFLKQLK